MSEADDRTEVLTTQENPLNGVILIHGFRSNTGTAETTTINRLLENGCLVTPSRRPLDEKEEARTREASFDINRICFNLIRSNTSEYDRSYVGQSLIAFPLNAVPGTYLTQDPDGGDLAVFHPEGVSIPIERGVLFMSDDIFYETLPQFQTRAQTLGLTINEYVNKYVVILPVGTFSYNNNQLLRQLIESRVQPSANVTAKYHQLNCADPDLPAELWGSNVVALHRIAAKNKPTPINELGDSGIYEGQPIPDDTFVYWRGEIFKDHELIEKIAEGIDEDPYQISNLYENPLATQKIKVILENLIPDSEILESIRQFEQYRQDALAKNIEIIEKLYQEQIAKVKPKRSRPLSLGEHTIHKDNRGRYVVETPI